MHVLRFPVNVATLPGRLATLHLVDPTVDLQLLSDSVPQGAGAEAAPCVADHAQALAPLLKRAQTEGVPDVDIQSCLDMSGEISIASLLATEARQADNSPAGIEPRAEKGKGPGQRRLERREHIKPRRPSGPNIEDMLPLRKNRHSGT